MKRVGIECTPMHHQLQGSLNNLQGSSKSVWREVGPLVGLPCKLKGGGEEGGDRIFRTESRRARGKDTGKRGDK